ncbi:glycosyltransferase family 39 protein [Candidatus Saganbacteria bacterium]|nr:glycosyltransferase family 39 protein [Candidatus Saganbacteria bacterium]
MFSAIKANRIFMIFLFILLLGSFIRIYDPIFRSLWGDEAHSIYSVSGHFDIKALAIESHLPAYFAILFLWIKVFGPTEYGLRMLSVIIGIFSMIAMYLFVKDTISDRAALVCAGLLAFSPLAIMHSHEIRLYGLMLLLSILSAWSLFRLLYKQVTIKASIVFILCTLLLGLTQIYSALMIFSQFVLCAIIYLRKKDANSRLALGFLLIVSILIFPLYFKIIIHAAMAVISGTPDMAFSTFPPTLKLPLIFFVLALGETVAPWNIIVIPSLIIIGSLLIFQFIGSKDEKNVYMMIFLVMPIVIASILPSTMPKYLIFTLPFYIALLGISLSRIKNPVIFYILFGLILLFQSISIANYFTFNEYHNSNQIEPWREVSQIIEKEHLKGDLIAATNRHITYNILKYYLPGDYEMVSLVNGHALLKPSELIAKRIWLITNIVDERVFPKGYIESIKLSLGNNYRLKMIRKFVPYESTLVSKLPINRHKKGSYRITVSLYEKIG